MSWKRVLGRVSFINCDPIFHAIGNDWKTLSAPPSWLTGHLLRRDCITAPIPAVDYANYCNELVLLRDIGIVGRESVGSVILFGNRSIESMRDIALPSDSSTSNMLMRWILAHRGLDPKLVPMGPDIETMLDECDGALIIGDRALSAALTNPKLVRMDLGNEWSSITGLPMVFGVFAARMDSSTEFVNEASESMLSAYKMFLDDDDARAEVISIASRNIGIPEDRVSKYYESEVSNFLDGSSIEGLKVFLNVVCGMEQDPCWLEKTQSE
jgi:chorismate dehydratase